MKNRIVKRIISALGIACCALTLTVMPVRAAAPITPIGGSPGADVSEPCAAIKQWRFKIMDGKLYKRLANLSTAQWEGDWIYVCEWTGGDLP